MIRVIARTREQDGPDTAKPVWSTFVIDAPDVERALAKGWEIVGVELVNLETAERDHQRIQAELLKGGR